MIDAVADPVRAEPHVAADEIWLLGYRFHPRTGDEVVAEVIDAVKDHRRLVMANGNLHALALMFESPAMSRLMSQPETRIMIDGMPILFFANLMGHRLSRSKRTTSLEFYDAMFAIGAERGWKFGYVGGDPVTLNKGLDILRHRFPTLNIDGRDGFFDMDDMTPGSRHRSLIDWLKERSHDVVIVGMGMPRQEAWIEQVQNLVDSRVFMPTGAYLDYQAGVQVAAPRWLGQIGMEWAFRLVMSPRRLGYRYLIEPVQLIFRLLTRRHPMADYRKNNL